MPPKIESLPVPTTRGKDAKEWMEYHGFVATTPSIRSSDYEGVLHCPFQYYLSRRLGLTPALRWSKALSRGSWFHKRLELYKEEKTAASQIMEAQLQDRLGELTEICMSLGIKGSSRDTVLERERNDCRCAMGWFDACWNLPFGPKRTTLDFFINQSHFRTIGSELGIRLQLPSSSPTKKIQVVALYDLLLYHEVQNTLFIVDAKTCSESATDRLITCPLEFQTQHYMMILKNALKTKQLQKKFDLPDDVGVGGMIHLAIQKPTIEFGMKDRDCEEYEHTLKSGPRKGQIEIRKTYTGEPRLTNYIKRCNNWYEGTGEYEHLAPKWATDPPINISLTYGSTLLDPAYVQEYDTRLKIIADYARCPPLPYHFPRSMSHLRQFGRLSPFTPFYLLPPKEWPDLIRKEGFIQLDRDEGLEFIVDTK